MIDHSELALLVEHRNVVFALETNLQNLRRRLDPNQPDAGRIADEMQNSIERIKEFIGAITTHTAPTTENVEVVDRPPMQHGLRS